MAKKKAKKSIASSFIKAVAVKKDKPKKNPSGGAWTEVFAVIGPAAAGYAATRFLGRVARVQLGKRWPKLAAHAGPLSSAVSLLALWYVTEKWQRFRKYQTPVIIGSGIALLQSAVQTYMPGLAWLIDAPQARVGGGQRQVDAPAASNLLTFNPSPEATSDYTKDEDDVSETVASDPEDVDFQTGIFAPN